jgi:hypothetical protein
MTGFTVPNFSDPHRVFIGRVFRDDVAETARHVLNGRRQNGNELFSLPRGK